MVAVRFALLMLLIGGVADIASAQREHITMQVFEQWIFQNSGGNDAIDKVVSEKIELEISRIDLQLHLSDDQKARLSLAAQGDMHRFMRDVDVARAKFTALHESDIADNQFTQKVWELTSPLQTRWQSEMYGPTSMLQRVLTTTLTEEQKAASAAAAELAKRQKTDTAIAVSIAGISRVIAMTADQREALLTYMKQTVQPFEDQTQYKAMVMDYYLATIPDDWMSEHLREEQTTALRKRVTRWGGVERLKKMLVQRGLIDGK